MGQSAVVVFFKFHVIKFFTFIKKKIVVGHIF